MARGAAKFLPKTTLLLQTHHTAGFNLKMREREKEHECMRETFLMFAEWFEFEKYLF